MSYTRETWVELASTDPSSTPITAVRLNNIEFGIENSHGRSLATSDRDLLVSSDSNLFTGRVIWNNTLGLAQWWDGTTWASGSAGGEAPANVNKSTAVEGSSRIIATANHKHDVDVAAPVNISGTNDESTVSALARASHIHAHPPSQHEPGGNLAMAVNAASTVGSLRTLGTGSTEAAPGNHAIVTHDTAATGTELDTLTDGSTGVTLHTHTPVSHLIESHGADYEQGNFTPGIADDSLDTTGEGQAYDAQTGKYTQIGNRLFFALQIRWTSLGTLTGSDTAKIGGLPKTSRNQSFVASAVNFGQGSGLALTTAGEVITGIIEANVTHIQMNLWGSTSGTILGPTITQLSTAGIIIASGFYELP